MQAKWEKWWNRPCGGREVLILALPLVISTMSWTVMNFTDRMFLLWYRPDGMAMAAAMPAGMLFFTFFCFPSGVASYVNTFVAQYHGAGRPERIGAALWHGLRVGVLAIPVFLAFAPFALFVFQLAKHEPELAVMEATYFRVMCYGAGGGLFSVALSAFFTGRGKTRTVMCVDSAAAALNIALDYAWIFGCWGFPEMGIEGAAWATVISQWAKVFVYGGLVAWGPGHQQFGLRSGFRYDSDLWRRLWRFGGVNGLQLFIEVGAFTIFLLCMGHLGKEAMSATVLAFNVNSVAFVPMIGMGIGVSTLVGQQLGANRPDLAARGTWTGFTISLAYMSVFAVMYVTMPSVFMMGHAMGAGGEDFERLQETTTILLRFVAAYCLFDAMNLIFVSALKGAGDTRFILGVAVFTSPLPVILGVAGMKFAGWGLLWCWTVITGWICMFGVIYLWRFLGGAWKTMRVIETDALKVADDVEPDVAVAGETSV